jgi:putative phosphoribosyl transferase
MPDAPIGMVLFAHGSGSGRLSRRNNFVADELHHAQIATFLPDLLTSQEDQYPKMRFDISLLEQRLQLACDWLRNDSATRNLPIGLFGASTGAAAAVRLAAAHVSDFSAVVSRGGRVDMAGQEALRKLRVPTLLIVGELDDAVIDINRTALGLLSCEKRLEIVPNAGHLFEEAGALKKVSLLANSWFSRHFRRA